MREPHFTCEDRDVLINTCCVLTTAFRTVNDQLRYVAHEEGETPGQPHKSFPGVNIDTGAANQRATIQHVMICKIHVVGQETKGLYTGLWPTTCVKGNGGLGST